MGGNIAYEMAAILIKEGYQVNNVYMLDSFYIKNSLNIHERKKYASLVTKFDTQGFLEDEQTKKMFESASISLHDKYINYIYNQSFDMINYLPSKYNGDCIMFKATKEYNSHVRNYLPKYLLCKIEFPDKMDNGYIKFAPNMKIEGIEFSHESLMDEKAATIIAERIIDDIRENANKKHL